MQGRCEGDTGSFTWLPSTYKKDHTQPLFLKVKTLGPCFSPVYVVQVASTRERGWQGHMSARCPRSYSVPVYKMRTRPFQ